MYSDLLYLRCSEGQVNIRPDSLGPGRWTNEVPIDESPRCGLGIRRRGHRGVNLQYQLEPSSRCRSSLLGNPPSAGHQNLKIGRNRFMCCRQSIKRMRFVTTSGRAGCQRSIQASFDTHGCVRGHERIGIVTMGEFKSATPCQQLVYTGSLSVSCLRRRQCGTAFYLQLSRTV